MCQIVYFIDQKPYIQKILKLKKGGAHGDINIFDKSCTKISPETFVTLLDLCNATFCEVDHDFIQAALSLDHIPRDISNLMPEP